jgi:cellulose synthase/poly-beta-1,6-N-acetylglucosamine synthase-like glycosyltransferase
VTVAFWALAALLLYAYVGYGALLLALARLRPSRDVEVSAPALHIDLLIPAYNEAAGMERKLENTLALDCGPHQLHVVVVSDGSTDETPDIVRRFEGRGVRLVGLDTHVGKNAAINAALPFLYGDVVVFSDADTLVRNDALVTLVRHFGNPATGAVCGQLGVPDRSRCGSWLGALEALYRRYDQVLKEAESRVAGVVGAYGSFYAVRRGLIQPLPSAVSDDLMMSLRAVACGKRIVFEPRAFAEEAVASRADTAFERRVRSTEQGWRALMTMAGLLNPFRFGFFSVQLFSHKFLRRLTPFLLVLFFLTNLFLIPEGMPYGVLAVGQTGFYAAALLAWVFPLIRKIPGAGIPLFFVIGHAAMAVGVLNVLRGKSNAGWRPARDNVPDTKR